MFQKFIALVAATAVVTGIAAAQSSCPRTKAEHVPESISFRGVQNCGTIRLTVGALEVNAPGQGCPLIATYLPQHEIEVPSQNDTRVRVHAQLSSKVIHFRCDQDWFLILPWGSSCAVDRVLNGGPLLRMTTVGCTGG